MNGSLQARISGGRMTQSGRQEPVGPPPSSNEYSRTRNGHSGMSAYRLGLYQNSSTDEVSRINTKNDTRN